MTAGPASCQTVEASCLPEATFWFKFPFVSREDNVEFHLWSYLRQEKEQAPILSS